MTVNPEQWEIDKLNPVINSTYHLEKVINCGPGRQMSKDQRFP